jgi:CBS domain-containing protein
MERDVIAVRGHELVSDVLRTMEEHELRAVPVVDGFHRVVGIVTRRGLLRPSGGP